MEYSVGTEALYKRQGGQESALWVSDDRQLGQQSSESAKALNHTSADQTQRIPRFATKAATAAKRLQAVAAATHDDSRSRCLPSTAGLGSGEHAAGTTAEATPVDGAPTVNPSSAKQATPATGIWAPRNAATADRLGQLMGAAAPAGAPGGPRCTAGRARLPGLRTLNGLSPGLPGPANATGHGLAAPLLLGSAKGGPETLGAGAGAASCRGHGLGQAARLAPAPVPRCALPRGLRVRDPTGQQALNPSPPARNAGAFLPPPVLQPAALRGPPDRAPRRQQQQLAEGGAAGGVGDGARKGSEVAAGTGGEGETRAAVPPACAGDRPACLGGGAGGRLAGVASRVPQRRRWDDGADDMDDGELSDDASDGDSGDDGSDADEHDDLEDDVSSYGSCYSCHSLGSGSRSCASALEAAAAADADDESDEGDRKRRRIREAGAAAAAVIAVHACANATGDPAGCGDSADGEHASEPAAARAAGGAGTGPRHHKPYYCYGPPWPLVPRAGRPGMLRFNIRAARALWPELLEAAKTDPQLVTLHVELLGGGAHAAAVTGGGGGGGAPDGGGRVPAAAATVTPVRALLQHYDDTGVILKVVECWPLARGGGVCPYTLLQISPYAASGGDGDGDGALVQLANRHVWAYYRVRGGKLCCPEVAAAPSGAGGAVAAASGGGDAAAAAGGDSGPPSDMSEGGVLQLRLGANLFDNRSFDVGVRAAERLFGHLLSRPQLGRDEAGGAAPAAAAAGAQTGGTSGGDGVEGRGAGAGEGGREEEEAGGGGGAATAAGAAAAPVLNPASLPIQSIFITVVAEAWPQTRFKVEFRYRFPRMYGLASNARHSYATLASSLLAPLVLCGAQQGDVLEMWRRPGGAPDEFLCRVARPVTNGGGGRGYIGVKRGIGARAAAANAAAAANVAAAAAAMSAVAAAAAAKAAAAKTTAVVVAARPGGGGGVGAATAGRPAVAVAIRV